MIRSATMFLALTLMVGNAAIAQLKLQLIKPVRDRVVLSFDR
jgi:hypothetical protein